jgi:signal recognition particle subunit SRP54
LQASRKKRIAKGAGLEVRELNRLLKMQRQMSDMMKKLGRGKGGMLKQAMKGMFGGKGAPSEAEIAQAAKSMGGLGGGGGASPALPPGFPGLPGGGGMQLPPGLSGFGKKKK